MKNVKIEFHTVDVTYYKATYKDSDNKKKEYLNNCLDNVKDYVNINVLANSNELIKIEMINTKKVI